MPSDALTNKEWFERFYKIQNPVSVRLAAALMAFDPENKLEFSLRKILMAKALAVEESAIDTAMDELRKVGLAEVYWLH